MFLYIIILIFFSAPALTKLLDIVKNELVRNEDFLKKCKVLSRVVPIIFFIWILENLKKIKHYFFFSQNYRKNLLNLDN